MSFAVVVLAALLILVTSISSVAGSTPPNPPRSLAQQQLTPTPSESDGSVAGSTDGIVWMGILIALIVLAPMLASRALWTRQA
jgi:hypothetical protein